MTATSDQYEVLEEIGRGSFGSVRRVRRKSDGKLYVRKEIRYGHMNMKERAQLISEFKILNGLKHPNIVEFVAYDYEESNSVVFLYMEYCGGGDLSKLVKRYRSQGKYIPEEMIWSYLTQMLMALYRCHYGMDPPPTKSIFERAKHPDRGGVSIIHRDIKPGNIFLMEGEAVAKLGDFGLAKALGSSVDFATTYVGTPYYMSPEVLMDQPYSPLSDIWSLGCVIYELCALHPPFQAKTYNELQGKIKKGVFKRIPDVYSEDLQIIIEACIDPDLNRRPSTYVLLEDRIIKSFKKEIELQQHEEYLASYEAELLNIEAELEKNYKYQMEAMRSQLHKEAEQYTNMKIKEILQKYNIKYGPSAAQTPPVPDLPRMEYQSRMDHESRLQRKVYNRF